MSWKPGEPFTIILFYKYGSLSKDSVGMLIEDCLWFCENHGILGRLLVSEEGVNGTLSGSNYSITKFIDHFYRTVDFGPIDWKYSYGEGNHLPFLSLSVREVREIIAVGQERDLINNFIEFDKDSFGGIVGTGMHLTPSEFHSAIQSKDSIVLDIRNEFEYNIGHFENSKNLHTFTYAETWKSLDKVLGCKVPDEDCHSNDKNEECEELKQKPIYMYCTGGIRCEKASAYLKAKGCTNVFQLQGGIHRYLEEFPDGGLFKGKNFVFDSRVAVEAQESSETIIGHCLDCDGPHDKFSGRVVCTVCRTPILICGSCIQSNPHPDEYYCSRHRYFKGIYFTVLTQFCMEELSHQISLLQQLLVSFSDKSDRRRRRTINRQIEKINNRLKELQLISSSIIENVDGNCTSDSEQTCPHMNPQARGGWGFWRS